MAGTDTVRVTVTDGYAVYSDGTQHGGGSILTVDTDTAEQWITNGWVTPAPAKARSARSVPTG